MPGSSTLWDDIVPGSIVMIPKFYELNMVILCTSVRETCDGHKYRKSRTIKNFTVIYVETCNEENSASFTLSTRSYQIVQSLWLNTCGRSIDLSEDTFSDRFKNAEIMTDDSNNV